MKYSESAIAESITTEAQANVPVRVFLVEDMPRLQGLMAELLRSMGDFTLVGSAETEAEAIQWLKDHGDGWDLAVVDLILAQGSGIGVVARCRDRPKGAKMVVFSDYVTPVLREYCISLGADAAMPKSDLQAFMDFCGALARR
jgi:DNA-binding NarL/FixJ family response regulator